VRKCHGAAYAWRCRVRTWFSIQPRRNSGRRNAGQQPQNSRNTASVSQYDVACAHQK
jgi:hypothetical protein